MHHSPAPALVLFDIDGTLIRRAGRWHRDSLVEAIRRVTGIETTTDHIPTQGMLDGDILRTMLLDAGASEELVLRSMREIAHQAQHCYVEGCPDLRTKVCPGVRPLLSRLRRHRIPAALVTGNLTRIGWKKMEHAGLKHHFRYGAFAEMAATRAELVAIAIETARRRRWIERGTQVTLIGDHMNDIRAAQANGVRVIAVATGLASREDLALCRPDFLVNDLRSVRLSMLLGPSSLIC
jgi:phosphoglycolate phosphatase-like HAD superfamily hydrolase